MTLLPSKSLQIRRLRRNFDLHLPSSSLAVAVFPAFGDKAVAVPAFGDKAATTVPAFGDKAVTIASIR